MWKFGEMEINNLLLNMNPEALCKMNMLYSSSIVGRRDIGQIYEDGILPDKINLSPDSTNRNAEILRVYLKARGIGIRFKDEEEMIEKDKIEREKLREY